MEMALINAIQRVFPTANHTLCPWHVDKNDLVNCKSSFDTEDEWQKFYDDWHKILFAVTEAIFEEKCEYLQHTYGQVHWLPLMYLEDDLLAHWKTRVIKCFTNKVQHYGNTTTSHAEGGHATLKRSLAGSAGR